ncbi:methylated-DNA--[protein]-cysteine S-methyltransferase [Halobium salinum]|uniref:Methylated-DNA--[protein]-cysteine S-methyltransferase n=1 Tax=Halobium salinum TaxID=1364940 RepID=A0ABD5PDK2_9EURY|nr:methylated-DNA--[protein]-cysteine S-methyltransferase [Halobium salinum]
MRLSVRGDEYDLDCDLLDASPEAVRTQVAEYERGERRAFDLPVSFPAGLTGEVMRAMVEIPYGETRTYGEIAAELDTAAQPVGGACGRNPLPVVVPCHRVVAADGLGGFSAAAGVDAKRRLLAFERGESLDAF